MFRDYPIPRSVDIQMHYAIHASVLKLPVHLPVSVLPIVPRILLDSFGWILPVLAMPEAQLFVHSAAEFQVLLEFEPVVLPEPNRPAVCLNLLRHLQLAAGIDVPHRVPHAAGRHVDAFGRNGARVHFVRVWMKMMCMK